MFARLLDILTKRGRTDGYGGEGPDVPVTADGMPDDPVLVALTRELGALGTVEVPAAARERTWALMRQELEQRPVTAHARRSARREGAGTRRWALGSAALVAASALALVVAFAGFGDDDDRMAGTDTETTRVTQPDDPTPGTDTTLHTGGTVVPGTEGTGTSTTVGPATTATDTPPQTTTPSTAGAPSSTLPPTTRPPITTEPPQTTTTGRPVMTRQQREDSASGAAFSVANLVIAGDLDAAGRGMTAEARRQLTQMAALLENPSKVKVTTVDTDESGGKVLVVFTDLVDDGQGGVIELARRFFMYVQFDDGGRAIVVRIAAANS